MHKSLIAYALYGGSVLVLYGTGGFSGWWKGFHMPKRTSVPSEYGSPGGSPGGTGYPGGSSGHGGFSWGSGGGGGSSGGGFRGGK